MKGEEPLNGSWLNPGAEGNGVSVPLGGSWIKKCHGMAVFPDDPVLKNKRPK